MYLKVSPSKGVMRFGNKEKLSHRYIEPYEYPRELATVLMS